MSSMSEIILKPKKPFKPGRAAGAGIEEQGNIGKRLQPPLFKHSIATGPVPEVTGRKADSSAYSRRLRFVLAKNGFMFKISSGAFG